jgi:hypothetical protein
MALTLIKEDGSVVDGANSYASVADSDAYHEAHLYASAWTSATTQNKTAALVMATRLIDSEFQFNGYKTDAEQALMWPRTQCPDPDSSEDAIINADITGPYFADDVIPSQLVDAVCELARRLLVEDRTADATGGPGGIDKLDIAGAIMIEFNENNPKPVIPNEVSKLLWKFGRPSGAGGTVKLSRS